MDAIKVIKKHGQPGGLPVITVFVDEDAPGENQSLYLHHITFGANHLFGIDLITSDSTPFTYATLISFLSGQGYTAYNKALPISGAEIVPTQNKFRQLFSIYIKSTVPNDITVRYNEYTFTIEDGAIKITTLGVLSESQGYGNITDSVFEIE